MTTKVLQRLLVLAATAGDDYLINKVKAEMYSQQVVDFKQHVIASAPPSNATDEQLSAFENNKWLITYDGKTVEIVNEASVYAGLLDVIKDYVTYHL